MDHSELPICVREEKPLRKESKTKAGGNCIVPSFMND